MEDFFEKLNMDEQDEDGEYKILTCRKRIIIVPNFRLVGLFGS